MNKRSSALCCITHCYYQWHCEPVCQTQRASSPQCWCKGGCGCCWERQPGSSVDHKAFTQQIHQLAFIIIISICLLVRLCHSTVHLRLQWSKKTDGGLRAVQTPIFLNFKTFFNQKIWKLWKLFWGLATSHQYFSKPELWQYIQQPCTEAAARIIPSSQVQ